LKCPRSTRAEELPGSAERLVELGGRDVVEETRVVVVVKAANVRDVEQVEDLGDELKLVPLIEEFPGFGDTQIEGIKVVAELQVWIDMHESRTRMARNLIDATARG